MPRQKLAAFWLNFAVIVAALMGGFGMWYDRRQHDQNQDASIQALQKQVDLNVNELTSINQSLEKKLRVEPADVQKTVQEGIDKILSRLPESH